MYGSVQLNTLMIFSHELRKTVLKTSESIPTVREDNFIVAYYWIEQTENTLLPLINTVYQHI